MSCEPFQSASLLAHALTLNVFLLDRIGPPNKIQQRALPFLLKGSDIIAQAPPTQERIVAYVVPGINACLLNPVQGGYKGPQVVVVTTTVDQATQAYKVYVFPLF